MTSVPRPGRAERVIVIALQKSGTHLIAELMHALGYALIGSARIAPERLPRLTPEDRGRIAAATMTPGERRLLALPGRRRAFERRTDAAWDALSWSWRERLGLQLVNQYDQAAVARVHADPALAARLARTPFGATPADLCWIFHELQAPRIDGAFLREWTDTGEPRMLLHYRDPRDVLVSFVNYLAGRTPNGIGNFSHYWSFSRTLEALGAFDDQLLYAIRDPCFPGHDDFRNSLWMLSSPLVCKTSFEELIGPAGGGSAAAQLAAIARVTAHLGIEEDAVELAAKLYRRDAFTFFKGQIGAWRESFRAHHARAFATAFGDLPELYGYAPTLRPMPEEERRVRIG